MDQEEEDGLDLLKNGIMELLKDISYIGGTIQKKSHKILSKISNTSHSDIDSLETIGLGIINILKTVKGNMLAITNTFEENIEKLNKDREEKVLMQLSSMLLDYKTTIIAEAPKNTSVSKVLCDKAMQTDLIRDNNNSDDYLQPKTETKTGLIEGEDLVEDENKPQESVNRNEKVSTAQDKLRKGGLSLKKKPERTDTQDTDDCWTDSLVRSPTLLDLWNREYHGEAIHATDEYLDQLKKEQEADNDWNRETVNNFNPYVDKERDSSDDSFVDGRTPEEEKELIKELDMSAKHESLFSIEEHKLSDLGVDTAPNSIKAKDDSAAIEKTSITDKSDLQPEENMVEESSVNLNINKETTPLRNSDYDNPKPGCSRDQTVDCTNKIHCDDDKNLESGNKTENLHLIDTDISECAVASPVEIDWSQSMGVDSLENVKIDSGNPLGSQCSEHSESSIITQVISSEKMQNNQTITEDPSSSTNKENESKEPLPVTDNLVENCAEPHCDLEFPNTPISEDRVMTPDPIQSSAGPGLEVNLQENSDINKEKVQSVEHLNDNLQECKPGQNEEINESANSKIPINNQSTAPELLSECNDIDKEQPKADSSNSSPTRNDAVDTDDHNSFISDTTHSDNDEQDTDKILTDTDEANMNNHMHNPIQSSDQTHEDDRFVSSTEMEAVSDKPQRGSGVSDDTTNSPKSRQDISEQVEQPGTSTDDIENPVIQELNLLHGTRPDSPKVVCSDISRPDSVETVLYGTDLGDAFTDDKCDTEKDKCQLTQVIDSVENDCEGTKDSLIEPLRQEASTETDTLDKSDLLSKNVGINDSIEMDKHTTISGNVDCHEDNELPFGDEERQVKDKGDFNEKECCAEVMVEEDRDSHPSELVPDVTMAGAVSESIDKSSVATNLQIGDNSELDQGKTIRDGERIETENLENPDFLSQDSAVTQISNCDVQSLASQDLSEVAISDDMKSKELKLSTIESCDQKLCTSGSEQISETNLDNNSMEKLGDDEDDVCSSESFEFDIHGCFTKGVCEENVGEKSEKIKDDIIEALEELLSQDNEDDNLRTSVITKNQSIIRSKDCSEKGIIKETIEIESDSDDDGVHLDVTMEEIISSGSSLNVECVSDQEDNEKIEDIEEIIPLNPDYIKEEIVIDSSSSRREDDLADELLELLREVELPSQINKDAEASNNVTSKSNDKTETKEADEIFKMLDEESDTDISDVDNSDEDIDLSSSDLEWIDDNKSNKKPVEEKKNIETQSEQPSKNCDATECYVALERLEIDEYEVVKVNKKITDSIDRLCDISNLLKKRKFTQALGLRKSRSKRKKISKQGISDLESDSESFSDFTDSETEKDKSNISSSSPILPAPLEQKLDDILANAICNVFKGNTSDESSDYDSDGSHKIKKKNKKDKSGDGKHSDSDKKEKLSKEELKKKAWKNDPLLRGKLNSSESDSSTSSTSSSEKSRRRRNAIKTKYEHDTDFYIVSDSSDTDSDGSLQRKQNKVLMEEKLISPIKKNIPISDSDSTDSEIEFIPQQKTPEKNITGEEEGPSNSQKGRRNIRALMSDESLAEATQRANKDEQERIERLEDRCRIKETFSQSFSHHDEEEDLDALILDVDVKSGEPVIKVHPGLNKILKPHQRDGIQFMWDSCYESIDRLKDKNSGSGCILAHCMGLGKTFQVLALIHTLFTHEITNTKHVLVVCPLSTVNNWKKEVKILFKDFPEEKFNVLTIADKKETSKKYEIVKKWYLKRKCVLVLGYEAFETLTNECKLDKGGENLRNRMLEALVDPGPDLVICDEGHLLRNKKALKTLALNRIRTKRRIVLTGTPLQNNLMEYYHMVQFIKPNLLGNMKEFKTNFENPITNGQYEDSTKDDINLMMKRTHVLHKLLKKSIQRVEDTELKIYLPKIVDYAIFIQLHPVQVDMYSKFSELVAKNSEDTNRRGFLSDFRVFQYIGTHPYLLSVIDNMKNKKIKERDLITNEHEDNPMCNIDNWWKAKVPDDASEKIDYGHKLMAVKSILEECEEIGDKVLLFSQSLGEMDVIEHFLKKVGTARCSSWKKKIDYFRMDGTVSPEYRSVICDLFNDKDNKKIRLLLMSTKVGGLGLNLTAANRVIIMTVNWNPSLDTQSVFRVYRFGQEKAVFVYRLISLDTMEEKVYQRTVTKLAIAHRVVDKHQITRHYKSMDLQELYSCIPNAEGERTMPNLPEDLILGKLILKLPFIFKYHEHQALLANRPEDNLNEQELNAAWDEFKKIKDAAKFPPPQLLAPQQIVNAPTFNMAYNLTRPVAMNNTATGKDIEEHWIQQYYIPKLNTSLAPQKNGQPDNSAGTNNSMKVISNKTSNGTNLNAVFRKPNLPPNTVISVEKNVANPGLIPLPSSANNTTNTEQDPLFIPLSTKPIKSYNDMLKQLSDNQQFTKLVRSTPTSKSLENNLAKSSQKENFKTRKTKSLNIPTNKSSSSIVIEDDEVENNNLSAPKLNLAKNNTSSNRIKRKLDETNGREKNDVKRIKYQDNTSDSQNSINLDDDDDDITEITDSMSDSGSLSSDIIRNLGLNSLNGITIHKVTKESTRNNNIITLD